MATAANSIPAEEDLTIPDTKPNPTPIVFELCEATKMSDSDTLPLLASEGQENTQTRKSDHIRKSSWGNDILPPRKNGEGLGFSTTSLVDVNLNSPTKSVRKSVLPSTERNGLLDVPSPPQHPFFGVWINSMRRRSTKQHKTAPASAVGERKGHKKSDSGTSSAGIIDTKTASISQGSFSVVSNDRRKGWLRSGTRSSTRNSEDLGGIPLTPIDEGILQRGLKRQNILMELVSTEELYVEDLKVLTNVCPRN
jgi:hypothetical protein